MHNALLYTVGLFGIGIRGDPGPIGPVGPPGLPGHTGLTGKSAVYRQLYMHQSNSPMFGRAILLYIDLVYELMIYNNC